MAPVRVVETVSRYRGTTMVCCTSVSMRMPMAVPWSDGRFGIGHSNCAQCNVYHGHGLKGDRGAGLTLSCVAVTE